MSPFPLTHKTQLLELDGVTRIRGERFLKIYAQGEAADFVYLVESGLVKVMVTGLERTEIVLKVVPPGGLFGLIGVLQGSERTANAVALTRTTIIAIPAAGFLEYGDRYPEFWNYVTKSMAKDQAALHQRIQLLTLHDVQYRLVSSLIQLSEMCGSEEPGSPMHSIPLSQEDISVFIGATRETTSNKLNLLAKRKLVLLGRRRVAVPSLENLRAALNGKGSATPE